MPEAGNQSRMAEGSPGLYETRLCKWNSTVRRRRDEERSE